MTNVAKLDASVFNARIEFASAEIQKIDRAIATAEARIREIVEKLNAKTTIDGAAIADALLSDDADKALTASSRQLLIEEKDGLAAGRSDLLRRREQLRADIAQAQAEFRAELQAALEPQIANLYRRFQSVARELGTLYADANAVHAATRAGEAFGLMAAVQDICRNLSRHLPLSRDPIPAGKDALAVAQAAMGHGRAAGGSLAPTSIPPW